MTIKYWMGDDAAHGVLAKTILRAARHIAKAEEKIQVRFYDSIHDYGSLQVDVCMVNKYGEPKEASFPYKAWLGEEYLIDLQDRVANWIAGAYYSHWHIKPSEKKEQEQLDAS